MNYPVMTSAFDGTTLTVDGTLDTVPNKFNNMFFFANRECDPSGYGEGELPRLDGVDLGRDRDRPRSTASFTSPP